MAAFGSKVPEGRHGLRVHLVGESVEERAEVRAALEAVSEPALEIVRDVAADAG